MTHSFWNKSMITKPKDREVQCHASAMDFLNGFDYRHDYSYLIIKKVYIKKKI